MNVARDQSTSYVVLYTEFSERFPTYFLSHHIREYEINGMCTYVLEGLTSSTFLWNGCCVGVAAETETVDELCPSGQHAGRSSAGSISRTMMKQKLYHLIRRPSGKNESCPTAVECRRHAQSLRAVGAERVVGTSFVKRNSSSLPSGAWQNLALVQLARAPATGTQ